MGALTLLYSPISEVQQLSTFQFPGFSPAGKVKTGVRATRFAPPTYLQLGSTSMIALTGRNIHQNPNSTKNQRLEVWSTDNGIYRVFEDELESNDVFIMNPVQFE